LDFDSGAPQERHARHSATLSFISLQANFIITLAFLLSMKTGIRNFLKRRDLLYVLLLGTNLIMAGLVSEQARVIESQKVLIKSLFFDTTQLAALKLRQLQR